MKYNSLIISLFFIGSLCCGCGKTFLDMKPNQTQRIPMNITDYQAMLDNTNVMNQFSCHLLDIVGADEYYLSDARYDAFQTGTTYNYQKRAYSWNAQIYEGGENNTDWSRAYIRILQTNIILDGLKNIEPGPAELEAYYLTKGSAHFFRAMAFYSLVQLFALPYNATTAETDIGMPLRLEADVTIKTKRSSIAQTYRQILSDLEEAAKLPEGEPKVIYRPSKTAAHALLSRVYLQMGNYPAALEQANIVLSFKNGLNDFNSMNLTERYIFPSDGTNNPELIFFSSADNVTPMIVANHNVATDIINSYTANDLRKKAYFFNNTDGRILFKGAYTGSPSQFTGLAVDELLLNRAECYARGGNVAAALADLNSLAIKRYDKTNFVSFTVGTPHEALALVLSERRKELLLRGLRWEDLRRLNKEPAFAKTLTRTIKGQLFQLPPNSSKYTWPIPLEAITSGGYSQNER